MVKNDALANIFLVRQNQKNTILYLILEEEMVISGLKWVEMSCRRLVEPCKPSGRRRLLGKYVHEIPEACHYEARHVRSSLHMYVHWTHNILQQLQPRS